MARDAQRARAGWSMAAAVLVVGLIAGPAWAWHYEGHRLAALAAVEALGDDVPAFWRAGGEPIAHYSQDPDLLRDPALPQLRDAEGPEHFFDLELLEGADLPPTRYAFLRLCERMRLNPRHVGTAPYAIAEHTQRLAFALAEHRRWPDNEPIRAKVLLYAGHLAHYAADLCQPLHTTIHFDGRVGDDGRSPRTGIHQKSDALPRRLDMTPARLAARIDPAAYDDLFPAIVAALHEAHALVDRVYELEGELPPAFGPGELTAPVRRFTEERMAASADFIASLYLTAWRLSAEIEVPDWLRR